MNNIQQIATAVLNAAANILGKGPVWHAERNSFFWIDIEGKKLNEMTWTDKQVQTWQMPQRIGMVVIEDGDNLIVALQVGWQDLI